jgi:hypothetical protein
MARYLHQAKSSGAGVSFEGEGGRKNAKKLFLTIATQQQ